MVKPLLLPVRALLVLTSDAAGCVNQNTWRPTVDPYTDPNTATLSRDEADCRRIARPPRWTPQMTVTEIVLLSDHGVPPDEIVEKMERSGMVYYLRDEQYVELREKGVTPMVIEAMMGTYSAALIQYPKLADDEYFHCFQLGFDGVWYGGGPWGFHPDC